MTLLKAPIIGALRVYQWCIRPILPMSCRYWPSCSEYAIEAIGRHGPFAGTLVSRGRVARCHPWGGEGLDPVPDRKPRFLLGRHRGHRDCGSHNHNHI